MSCPQRLAEQLAFRSFVNCYMREIDKGYPVQIAGSPNAIGWELKGQNLVVAAEITAHSLCGPCQFGAIWSRSVTGGEWQPIRPLDAVQRLMQNCYAYPDNGSPAARHAELDLLHNLLASYQAIYRNILNCPEECDNSFIDAEQSLCFGHWQHPTPKSLSGMADWQAARYAPERRQAFAMQWFAVKRERVIHGSAIDQPATKMVRGFAPDSVQLLAKDEVALPMHPLQAEWLILQPHVAAMMDSGQMRLLGAHGLPMRATSSVRTLYSAVAPWMIKFSLPVRITNSVRRNTLSELHAAVAVAKLFQRLDTGSVLQNFCLIQDPAFLAVSMQGPGDSGFEMLLRDNPFRNEQALGVATLAALTADPLPSMPSRLAAFIAVAAHHASKTAADAAIEWFDAYCATCIAPIIRLYDRFGIAFEAHQQNSLMRLHHGMPVRGYYRDSEGFYLAQSRRETLTQAAPELAALAGLFHDEGVIEQRLSYYLLGNQLFSVIYRLAADGLGKEQFFIDRFCHFLQRLMRECGPLGRSFVQACLQDDHLCFKTNLKARLQGIDELASGDTQALYATLANPLSVAMRTLQVIEADHAAAG